MKYYTYVFSDPKTKTPIYIGKGTENRCYDHYTSKSSAVYEYLKQNPDTVLTKVAINQTEDQAFTLEAFLIEQHQNTLLNKCKGHKSANFSKIGSSNITRIFEKAKQQTINSIIRCGKIWTKESILLNLQKNYNHVSDINNPHSESIDWDDFSIELGTHYIYEVIIPQSEISDKMYLYCSISQGARQRVIHENDSSPKRLPNTSLTIDQESQILQKLINKDKQSAIAAQYLVSPQLISKLKKRFIEQGLL